MQTNANQQARKIAIIYTIVAGAWILFSDELVERLIQNEDARVYASICKGWVFVVFTAACLYFALRRLLSSWMREVEQREQAEAARAQAGEQLRESEERLRLIAEASEDGLWDWNLETGIAYLSPGYWKLTGYEAGSLTPNLEFYQRIIHPEDWPAAQAKINEHLAGKSDRSIIEYRMITKAGDVKWVWGCGKVVARAADGRPLRMVGNITDVTQRKLAEAEVAKSRRHYQTLLQTASDGIHVLNEQGELLEASTSFYRMLGYAPENPPALKLTDWDAQWSAAELRERFSQLLKTPAIFETQHRRQDGKLIAVEIHVRGIEMDGRHYLYASSRDITERKLAETNIRQSEMRYRQLFELESDALFLVDCETHMFLDANQSAQRLYGFSREELLQMRADQVSAEPEKTRQMVGSGFTRIPLRWHRKKDGQVFPVEITASIIEHPGRRAELSAIRDITDRQQTLQKYQEATAQLLEAQHIASLGSYSFDVKQGTWTSSKVLDELFGIVGADFQKDVHGWLQLIHPQERGELKHYLAEKVVKGRAGFNRVYRIIRHNDQQERWVHGLGKLVLDQHGQVAQMVGIIQDITLRKRAEEHLNLQLRALTAAANAIVITNRTGKIEWVNPAFTRLTGYTAAEAVGSNTSVLKSGQHPPAFYSTLWATVLTGNVWHGELINRRKNGQHYTEEMTVTPVSNESGQIVHFIAVKSDITERRLFEKRIQQAQKLEAIGTLAGGIAHDFNNILAAMFGYGFLLQQDTADNPAAQEDLAEILKAATRAKDLVQQILTFSRQREQKRLIIPLDNVVKEAMKFLRASLPANITIETDLANNTPNVLADPTQIYQVAINLATNALHAMEGRTGQLKVRLSRFAPTAEFIQAHREFRSIEYAQLIITDTGHGMDATVLERIFEPFFTTKPVGKGTGLGLAVVHGIVESHDGIITVASEVGKGTTFSLYFPEQKSQPIMPDVVATPPAIGHGQKILLLDDEAALTAPLQRLLQRMKYQVAISNNPREAVNLVRDNPALFDVIVTDLTMPEMNGLEVARQMHAVRPELPVILVSGLTPDLNQEKLNAAGIFTLLEKPVSMTILADVLQRALAEPKD